MSLHRYFIIPSRLLEPLEPQVRALHSLPQWWDMTQSGITTRGGVDTRARVGVAENTGEGAFPQPFVLPLPLPLACSLLPLARCYRPTGGQVVGPGVSSGGCVAVQAAKEEVGLDLEGQDDYSQAAQQEVGGGDWGAVRSGVWWAHS